MKLEHQVVSLELSKRLKELGVKQESLFVWRICEPNRYDLVGRDWHIAYWENGRSHNNKEVSAFTVAELGEMLEYATISGFEIAYSEAMDLVPLQIKTVEMAHNLMTKPDIAAKMLIYLLENELITL